MDFTSKTVSGVTEDTNGKAAKPNKMIQNVNEQLKKLKSMKNTERNPGDKTFC